MTTVNRSLNVPVYGTAGAMTPTAQKKVGKASENTASKAWEHLEGAGKIAMLVVLSPLIVVNALFGSGCVPVKDEEDEPVIKACDSAICVLQNAGITDVDWALTPDKAGNKDYINALIRLHKNANVVVNNDLVAALTLEKGTSPEFIQALLDLANVGIQINAALINNLSLEEAEDVNYIRNVQELSWEGAEVDADFIGHLTLAKGTSQDYVSNLKELARRGIEVDSWTVKYLTLEQGTFADYITQLKYLNSIGIDPSGAFIYYFTLDKAMDPQYIAALKYLRDSAVDVDAWIVKSLSISDAQDQAYLDALVANINSVGDLVNGRAEYEDLSVDDVTSVEDGVIQFGIVSMNPAYSNGYQLDLLTGMITTVAGHGATYYYAPEDVAFSLVVSAMRDKVQAQRNLTADPYDIAFLDKVILKLDQAK